MTTATLLTWISLERYQVPEPMEIKVDMTDIWRDWTDKQRMDAIKSLIWTAPDMHPFRERVLREIASPRFESTLD